MNVHDHTIRFHQQIQKLELHSIKYHVKVLLNSFYLNGQAVGFIHRYKIQKSVTFLQMSNFFLFL